MTRYLKLQFATLIFFAVAGVVQAQDSAVFDAQQGTWRLFYKDTETEQWVSKTYVQQNAIKPRIKTVIRWNGQQFSYQYQVSNRRDAKQAIDTIRIWGIPLVYPVPDLPPITANVKTDPDGEDRQQWAQLAVKRKFQNEVVKAPKGWDAGLRLDAKANQTSFVWTPGLKDTDPDGIAPGIHKTVLPCFALSCPALPEPSLRGAQKNLGA